MTPLLEINKEVIFDKSKHQYFKNGKELISCTTLIHLYEPPFDPDGHIVRAVAKRDNLTTQEVLNNWEQMKNEAGDKGHELHSEIEHYVKNGAIKKGNFEEIVKQFSTFRFKGELFSEIQIHAPSILVGGTCDLLEIVNKKKGILNLYDFKRVKKYEEKSKYGNKMLEPLKHLDSCNHIKFTIQMGIYEYILREHGWKVKDITIFWLNPKINQLEPKPIPHIQKDIKTLLEHFSSMTSF